MKCLDIGGCGTKMQEYKGARYPVNKTPSSWISINIEPSERPSVVGDAYRLPFANDTFHIVRALCFPANGVTTRLILEMERVLMPGGFALLLSGKDLMDKSRPYRDFYSVFCDVNCVGGKLLMGLKEIYESY